MKTENPVRELLDPNYSEYAPVANWKNSNQRWAQEHANKIYPKPSEGPSTAISSVCFGGVVVLLGIYFATQWVWPFTKALWAAR